MIAKKSDKFQARFFILDINVAGIKICTGWSLKKQKKVEIQEEKSNKKKKKGKKRFGIFFAIIGAGLAISIVNNITSGLTYETVLASTAGDDTERKLSSKSGKEESDGIYDFKDNKTTGTITVTKEWSDKRTNSERPEPEIKISTKKPSKSTLGYTVTFHGNKNAGLVFDD